MHEAFSMHIVWYIQTGVFVLFVRSAKFILYNLKDHVSNLESGDFRRNSMLPPWGLFLLSWIRVNPRMDS